MKQMTCIPCKQQTLEGNLDSVFFLEKFSNLVDSFGSLCECIHRRKVFPTRIFMCALILLQESQFSLEYLLPSGANFTTSSFSDNKVQRDFFSFLSGTQKLAEYIVRIKRIRQVESFTTLPLNLYQQKRFIYLQWANSIY